MEKYYTIRVIVEEVDLNRGRPGCANEIIFQSPELGHIPTLQEASFLAGSGSATIIHDLKLRDLFAQE